MLQLYYVLKTSENKQMFQTQMKNSPSLKKIVDLDYYFLNNEREKLSFLILVDLFYNTFFRRATM